MIRVIARTATFLTVLSCNSFALAGVYTDDLSKCLVSSSSIADQSTLVQWIFSALALNPAVMPMSSVTAQQRDALNQKAEALDERLVFTDCHKEAVDALKYEGPSTFEAAFAVLGQVATRGLMSDPAVISGLNAMGSYTDKAKVAELYKDAGLPAPTFPAQK